MNLPNKITVSRIIISILMIALLIFPFESAGINFPNLFINELIVVNIKYIVVAVLFLIAIITDYIDGKIARKYEQVTEIGNLLDDAADKVLINSTLVVLASQGFIHTIIPVIVIIRDVAVSHIKMYAYMNNKKISSLSLNKVKSFLLRLGVFLTLIYNLPFELINLKVSDIILVIGAVISVITGFQYNNSVKKK